jgi:hypothetical protein
MKIAVMALDVFVPGTIVVSVLRVVLASSNSIDCFFFLVRAVAAVATVTG